MIEEVKEELIDPIQSDGAYKYILENWSEYIYIPYLPVFQRPGNIFIFYFLSIASNKFN
jgi:hypothetical protein